LAVAAAKFGLGHGVKSYSIEGYVREKRLHRITEILNKLEHAGKNGKVVKPDWDKELEYIQGGGKDRPTKVICDVFVKDIALDKSFAFELKAPLPNSDQTKVSKEKILKLHCMEPKQVEGAYFALPYNPYGTKEKYDWSFPKRWFNLSLGIKMKKWC
jgi:hypothetical protein